MSKNHRRALVLYQMDYEKWDSTFRQELNKGEKHYKKWFLDRAKKIPISDSVYNEVFLRNPLISTGITNILLEESYHQFKDVSSSDKIYFVVNPDPILRILKEPMYAQYKTPEIDSFSKILNDIANDKIFVVAEYYKPYGWFDYNELYQRSQKFKEQHELEMKQAQDRLRKEK